MIECNENTTRLDFKCMFCDLLAESRSHQASDVIFELIREMEHCAYHKGKEEGRVQFISKLADNMVALS